MRKAYFRTSTGAPDALRRSVERVVRFEEVDALGIVWHGRYPSYFEDGRVLLGEQFGIGYLDFYNAGIITPIKQMHVDYQRPLQFGEPFTIEAILHWADAVRLNHEFILRNAAGEVTTTGYSVQLLTDRQHNLSMVAPPFYEEFRQRWLAGDLS
jgi:acyl-CoA thioester hydrolase